MRYTLRDQDGASKIFDAEGRIAATINDESLLWMLADAMGRERHELFREADQTFLAGGPPAKPEEEDNET